MEKSIFNNLQNKLQTEEGLNAIHSAILCADIMNHYEDSVKEAVIAWADGANVDTFELDGNSVEDIRWELSCSSLQALCILNAIHRNKDIFLDAVLVEWKDDIV